MISIVVPSTGNWNKLERLCQSIRQQELSEDFEVLIVCNPKSLDVEEKLKTWPSEFKCLSSAKGANCARNAGIKDSKGRIVLFLDDDCVIEHPKTFSRLINALDQDEGLSACGGVYRPLSFHLNAPSMAYYYVQHKWLFEGRVNENRHRYLIGGHMAFKKNVLLARGLFDEELIFGGTETEWFHRNSDLRFQLLSESYVLHDYSLSFVELIRKAFLQGMGSAYLRRKLSFSKASSVRYGEHALLNILGLQKAPMRSLKIYKSAFDLGELCFQNHGLKRPSMIKICAGTLLRVFRSGKKIQRYLQQLSQVVINYRQKLDQEEPEIRS